MRKFLLAGAMVCGFGLSNAQATLIVNFAQVGTSVIATGSGSLNLTGLVFVGSGFAGTGVIASQGVLGIGPSAASADYYRGITGPSNFGPGGAFVPTLTSGAFFGVEAAPLNYLVVPTAYVSNALLAGTDTFANATFASLGLTAGTYDYTWAGDSFVINIPATPARVPEPASIALFALGALGIAGLRRRRVGRVDGRA